MKYSFLGLIIYVPLFGYISLDNFVDHDLLIYNKENKYRDCIAFVQDKTSKSTYIVKQKKKKQGKFTKGRQFKMVKELFSAQVAFIVGIQAQQVCLIPANTPFVGKKYTDLPATLHTIVPGLSLKNSKYSNINLRQRCHSSNGTNEEFGLSRSVINSMACHHELPAIVAFDTFIGDKGRHNNNLFFSEEDDTFYLIDMDGALSCNLAKLAYKQIEQIKNQGIFRLRNDEIVALNRYCDALRYYVETCSLKRLHDIFDNICKQCNFKTKKGVFTPDAVYIQRDKKILEENYFAVLDLISLLTSMDTRIRNLN